jgi:hypothetical protein
MTIEPACPQAARGWNSKIETPPRRRYAKGRPSWEPSRLDARLVGRFVIVGSFVK